MGLPSLQAMGVGGAFLARHVCSRGGGGVESCWGPVGGGSQGCGGCSFLSFTRGLFYA